MSKRFVDTELWQKEWFQDLSLKHKILLKYLFENCDCAGIWNINFRLASFIIGEKVSLDDIKHINSVKQQFEILDNKNIFVLDFIKFQYGTLSENCKPHKNVIEKLKKYNLFERVCKGYPKGIETLEEKEQYTEKEKDKDISSLVLSSLNENQKIYGEYNNVCLTAEQYNRLLAKCASQKLLDELIDSLSANIETGKEQPFRADFPNAHSIRLEKYFEFRKKHPERFNSKLKSGNQFQTDEQEEIRKIAAEWAKRGDNERT
jgi:hypothetical protein